MLLLVACEDQSTGQNQLAQPPEEQAGEKIYTRWCISCHLNGVSNAPRLSHPEDWVERLKKGRQVLLQSTIQGIAAMPPRGLCRSCSDEELGQAVDYMLDAIQEPQSDSH